MVSTLDDIEIVFDDDHAVTTFYQLLQDNEQPFHVGTVQTGRRFIENIERLARSPTGKFASKLDALRFTTAERGCWLTQLYIAESDFN